MDELTLAQARRLAVVSQGLGRGRPATAGLRQVRSTIERLGVLQIDSVNVLARAHHLPLWSRLGNYDIADLARLAYPKRPADRRVIETWAHMASYVPVAWEPYLRWHTTAFDHRALRPRPHDADALLAHVRAEGPVAASDLERRSGVASWWNWSESKRTLEWLFAFGELHVARRRTSFEREYDVPERVLPPEVLNAPTVPEFEARKALLLQSAGVLGVATADDLLDWWRLHPPTVRPLLGELVEDGRLQQVAVRGWTVPAYVLPGTVIPRRVDGGALVAPFDGLVFHRPRVERLWGVRFRIEIYVPEPQRVHGYYLLPFILGDRFAARVDLKADRAAGVLRLQAAHVEGEQDVSVAARALAQELSGMSAWLGLNRVEVIHRGSLVTARVGALQNGGMMT